MVTVMAISEPSARVFLVAEMVPRMTPGPPEVDEFKVPAEILNTIGLSELIVEVGVVVAGILSGRARR